jgi:hypothetical protein
MAEVGSLKPRGGRPPRVGLGWAPSGWGRTVMDGGNEFQGPHLGHPPPTPATEADTIREANIFRAHFRSGVLQG